MPKVSRKSKLNHADEALIIGFDSEWVTVYSEDGQPERNIILSCQFACRCQGQEWSGIIYPRAGVRITSPHVPSEKLDQIPERIEFAKLIAIAIQRGLKENRLTAWPLSVFAVAHSTRADLTAFADFSHLKTRFDGIHKCYVTLGDNAYKPRINAGGHTHPIEIFLRDTMLLVPGTRKKLAALGDLYGFPKLDPGFMNGLPYIEHMDWLLADDQAHFEAYGIRDAEVAVRHLYEIWKFAEVELGLRLKEPPLTLGNLAEQYLHQSWNLKGITVLEGKEKVRRVYSRSVGHPITTHTIKHSSIYRHNIELAKDCYHGARSECFSYGPTIEGGKDGAPLFRELDLVSAYPVALSSIGMPDWRAMHKSSDLAEFQPGVLGLALIRFSFPSSTRFPCLPVDAEERGLIFPLQGESCATASEIAVALRMGASIEIMNGVVVPWAQDGGRPFFDEILEQLRRRKLHAPGSLPNEMFKEMSNSVYGKTGQGLDEKRVFDTRTGGQTTIPYSKLTCPFLAAYVTGITRALIAELLASIPAHSLVISVTTDAIITDVRLDEIDASGPVATLLSAIKLDLTGNATLLEQKFEMIQLLPWATRGIATLKSPDGAKPKLAKHGMQAPASLNEGENTWFARSMLTRQPGDKWKGKRPLDFPREYRENADHIFREFSAAVSFEYDMKRRPVDPENRGVVVPGDPNLIAQHLAFETVPWRTIEEFTEARDMFERWRARGGQLKTIADWGRWCDYRDGAAATAAGVNRSMKKGIVDQARRLVVRAYRRGEWGLPGGNFKGAAARLTEAGYPTTEDDFKYAGRGKDEPAPEHLIPGNGVGVAKFASAVVDIWPGFEAHRLVVASARGEEIQEREQNAAE